MRLITIATYEHQFQVDLALALLADAGIPARAGGGYIPGAVGFFSGKATGLRIDVPADRADEARALLSAADEQASPID